MEQITEIAPDTYRMSFFAPEFNLQFNYFLVKDEEPLLFTTGMRSTFPLVREALSRLLDPAELRWVGFSHFEADECGALNQWLEIAPNAQPVCSFIGATVNVNDFANRPPKGLHDGEVLETGRHRFRFCSTAHLPHGWDAGLLFDETTRTLLCSDLFHQSGEREPLTGLDLLDRVQDAIREMQAGPIADYIPYTLQTERILYKLAELRPETLAIMHGSSYSGDGGKALRGLAAVMKETLGTGS